MPVGGELPRLIGPQIHLDDAGWDLPLFDPVEWLEIDLPHGERIRLEFEGDLFEMEDQRNWGDGSFKTASTPASLGYHHTIEAGARLLQKVTFRVEGASASRPRPREGAEAILRAGESLGRTVPYIGLGIASDGGPLSESESEVLRVLAPAHLRVDVRPGELELLHRGIREATTLGCELELALFVNGDESFLDAVSNVLGDATPGIARILVFDDSSETTPLALVALVRSRMPDVPVGGGTNIYFNELNRNRPNAGCLDTVAYSLNPQIHAFDELSLVESLEAQRDTVHAARAFCGDTPIAVTPITFRPRFNAVAVVEEPTADAGLPRQVDPRQMSLFGAAWTLGSIKCLAEAGAASLTYFETAGWRGVIERDNGAHDPAFPSLPGEVFPLYDTLRQVCALRGAELIECISTDPLSVTALCVRRGDRTSLLVANLEPVHKTVRIEMAAAAPLKAELAPYEVAAHEVGPPTETAAPTSTSPLVTNQ